MGNIEFSQGQQQVRKSNWTTCDASDASVFGHPRYLPTVTSQKSDSLEKMTDVVDQFAYLNTTLHPKLHQKRAHTGCLPGANRNSGCRVWPYNPSCVARLMWEIPVKL